MVSAEAEGTGLERSEHSLHATRRTKTIWESALALREVPWACTHFNSFLLTNVLVITLFTARAQGSLWDPCKTPAVVNVRSGSQTPTALVTALYC